MQSFIPLLQNREMTGYKVIKRTQMCFGRTDRAITIGRSTLCSGAMIICYMFFFNINVPFGSDYFVLISQHNLSVFSFRGLKNQKCIYTAGNRHKQNSRFCKEIREDNFRFWWRRVHEDASQGMYMSKIEICFFTALVLQNQRMLCCGECFHDQKHVQFIVVYEL